MFADRLDRARALMRERNVDVLLLSVGADLPYFCGYGAMPLERLTMLVVPSDGAATLVVPRLEAPRVTERPEVFGIWPWDETEDPVAIVAELAAAAGTAAVGDQMWSRFLVELMGAMPSVSWRRASEVTAPIRSVKGTGEIERLLDLVDEMLSAFGYPYTITLATKPEEKALGTDEEWDSAVKLLAQTLEARGIPFEYDIGGGAFYGPKLDFKLIDAIGRKWQGPTVQLDFNLPERFELEYVGEDNQRHRPVMLHRVLVGSMERFVGGLIEHYAGAFPLWLAPEQVRVLPVSKQWVDSAEEFAGELAAAGLRAEVVSRETLSYRIRDAEVHKIPYMAVIGEREAGAGTVAVRKRGAGKKQEIRDRSECIAELAEEVESKALG